MANTEHTKLLDQRLSEVGPGLSPVFKLASGRAIPGLGLGTWRSDKGQVEAAVQHAIEHGYRHIDCASVYANQDEVGRGIKKALTTLAGTVKREDLYIVSKLWNTDHHPEDVEPALRKTLEALQLDYLDLYLIHWPVSFSKTPDNNPFPKSGDAFQFADVAAKDTWAAMESLVTKGLVKDIGVSNFSLEQIDSILATATIKPACNQVECHPYLPQAALHSGLQARGILLVGYSPLGNLNPNDASQVTPLKDPLVLELATKYGKSPAQILIRWALDSHRAVLPKSITPSRIDENFAAINFKLHAEDVARLTLLGLRNPRRLLNPGFGPGGKKFFDE